jgi:hypothetical protein
MVERRPKQLSNIASADGREAGIGESGQNRLL